ncbi:MAG: TetR family transcriptional regulator [Devosia sp.]
MNEVLPFRRARKPEEQQLRREAILRAAAELFDAEGPAGAGLNAIAARAGFTKSNVYRYFESREEVLISLFLDELEGFVADLEQGLARCASGDLDAIAAASVDGFVARPRFCAMLAVLAGVLEQNVSESRIIALKRSAVNLYLRVAAALASKLPGASLEDCAWAGAMAATLVAGMWPSAHPSPVAARVLAMPEFAQLKPVPKRDLKRPIRALLASIA